jgi:hypothetical protein
VILSSPAAQAAWREAIGAPSVAVGVSEHSPAKLGSLGLDHIEAFDLPPGVETSQKASPKASPKARMQPAVSVSVEDRAAVAGGKLRHANRSHRSLHRRQSDG